VMQAAGMAGSSAFVLVEFPVRAHHWGLHLWEIGLVLGALPLGHLAALPFYPRLSRVCSGATICACTAFARGALLLAFAHQEKWLP